MIAAGDGGGAGLREQAARLSGQRRFDPDLRQPGGPRLDGRPRRAAAAADGARTPRHVVGIEAARRRAGLRLPCAAALQRGAGGCARRAPRASSRSWTTTAISTPTSRRRPGWCATGALVAAAGDASWPGLDERRTTGSNIERGDAPLISAFRMPASDLRRLRAALRLRHGWRAVTPTGMLPALYDFAAGLGATIVRTRCRARSSTSTATPPAPRSIPARRRPSSARRRPSTASRSISAGRRRTRTRSASGGGAISSPITPRLPPRSRGCAPAHGRVALYDAHSIRSRIPRLFEGELPLFNLGTNCGASCDRRP